jgi:hypothetical protein
MEYKRSVCDSKSDHGCWQANPQIMRYDRRWKSGGRS